VDIQSLRNVLIPLHAIAATISFFAGCFLLISFGEVRNQRWFGLYWWPLVGMAILLAGAMLVSWTIYTPVERIAFTGLFGLSIYMLYRAYNANRLLHEQPEKWKHNYIEHIGFTLISLFEGFIIVSGLNSGFPGWLVALIAILGVLLGRWLIGLAQQKN
jgi:hypothetical protein